MRNFFSGLAQCGAWACLDEFNRIDVEVLSVIAQQITALQLARKTQRSSLDFEGRTIKLIETMGIFITVCLKDNWANPIPMKSCFS
jgi:dynein heavy chain